MNMRKNMICSCEKARKLIIAQFENYMHILFKYSSGRQAEREKRDLVYVLHDKVFIFSSGYIFFSQIVLTSIRIV